MPPTSWVCGKSVSPAPMRSSPVDDPASGVQRGIARRQNPDGPARPPRVHGINTRQLRIARRRGGSRGRGPHDGRSSRDDLPDDGISGALLQRGSATGFRRFTLFSSFLRLGWFGSGVCQTPLHLNALATRPRSRPAPAPLWSGDILVLDARGTGAEGAGLSAPAQLDDRPRSGRERELRHEQRNHP
jgi:hypothetical protein